MNGESFLYQLMLMFPLITSKGDCCFMKITTTRIAAALHVINQHAKNPTDFPDFYKLKDELLIKAIKRGYAKKIGLDIFYSPEKDKKQTLTSIEFGSFYFHAIPTEADLRQLKMMNRRFRNPNIHMDLDDAENIILTYLNNEKSIKKPTEHNKSKRNIQSNISAKMQIKKRRISHEMRGESPWMKM